MHGLAHFGGAVIIFVAVLFVTFTLKWKLQRNFSSELFGAAVSASTFYWGREMRDLEKLPPMDWEGLMVPFGGMVGIFVIASCILSCFPRLRTLYPRLNNWWYQHLEQNAYVQVEPFGEKL